MAMLELLIRQASSNTSVAEVDGASTTATASLPVCTWQSHCLGDPCSSNNECDHDWVCPNGTCQTKPAPTASATLPVCTWESHCLGDKCSSNDDCDHDWICPGGVCQTSPAAAASTTIPACTWEFHCLGDRCNTYDDCDHDWICPSGYCQTYTTPPQTTSALAELNSLSPTSTPTPEPASNGLSTGAAVGIGVSVPAVVSIIAGIAFLAWRSHRRRKARPQDEAWKVEIDSEPRPPVYQLEDGKTNLELEGSAQNMTERTKDGSLVKTLNEPSNPIELDPDTIAPASATRPDDDQLPSDREPVEPDVEDESVAVVSPWSGGGSERAVSPIQSTRPGSRRSSHSRNYSYPFGRPSPPADDVPHVPSRLFRSGGE